MKTLERRQFTKLLTGGLLAAPVVAPFIAANASASEDPPLLDPEAPAAKGLQYIAVATDEKVNCKSCSLYTDNGSGEKGLCTIFPANSVPAQAWCVAYQPRS